MRYFLIGSCLAAMALAQVAVDANKRYQTPEGRAAVAQSLNDPHRDDHQKPKELVEAMRLKPGMAVVDIGTGTGYMLPFLHDAVGDKGRVFAEDIFDDFLARAKERVAAKGYTNVTFVKGTEHGINLPDGSVDVALILDAYHHFNYPAEMLASVSRALERGGRLVLVDYYKRPDAMPGGGAMTHIRIDYGDVVKEVEAAGFKLADHKDQIQNSQYLAVFVKAQAKR